MIPTITGALHDFPFYGNQNSNGESSEEQKKDLLHKDLIRAAAIPSWECVYFVRGGYVGARCANLGKPIRFQMYFVRGLELRERYSSNMAHEERNDIHHLCLNDIYPVFQLKHENCVILSNEITEGCLQKIDLKEVEHYKASKTSLDPVSRIQQGLAIFCFLLDTLPTSIAAIPQIEDAAQLLSADLIDFTLQSDPKENDMAGFELIKQLLDQLDK